MRYLNVWLSAYYLNVWFLSTCLFLSTCFCFLDSRMSKIQTSSCLYGRVTRWLGSHLILLPISCYARMYSFKSLVCIDYIYIYSSFIFYRVRLVVEKWGVDKSASWTRSKLNLRICYCLVHCWWLLIYILYNNHLSIF